MKYAAITMVILLAAVIGLTKGCGGPERPSSDDPLAVESSCTVTKNGKVTTVSCPGKDTEELTLEIQGLVTELEELKKELDAQKNRDESIENRIERIALDLEVLMTFKESTEQILRQLSEEDLLYRSELQAVQEQLGSLSSQVEEVDMRHYTILLQLGLIDDKIKTLASLEEIGIIYAELSGAIEAMEVLGVHYSNEIYEFRLRMEALETLVNAQGETVIDVIDLCGNANQLGEILIRLSDGSIIALYDVRKGERLVVLRPGSYVSTDGYKCKFRITEDMEIDYL